MATTATNKNNDVTMAVLSYFIFFLPLIAAKDSKLAMFHANQSLVLLIAGVASGVLGVVPSSGMDIISNNRTWSIYSLDSWTRSSSSRSDERASNRWNNKNS